VFFLLVNGEKWKMRGYGLVS